MANLHHKSEADLPMATLQNSRSKIYSKKTVLFSVALLVVAILVLRSFLTNDTSQLLLITSPLVHTTGSQRSTRPLASMTPTSEKASSRASSTSDSSSGKHGDVINLYLNHASTGNSYYKLIPECLDPIQPTDFLDIGRKLDSQKVMGNFELEECMEDRSRCGRPQQVKETCRTWSFYYDSLYNKWLQPKFAREDAESFQAVEIGFSYGIGHETLSQFLPKAELHSLEISCLPEGPVAEGKWPWGNFAKESKLYDELLSTKRLHCGNAYEYEFLQSTWSKYIHRPDAPPLQVVVEDGSYQSQDMTASLFFWFPRLEPGGMFFVEGIRPDDKQGYGPADQFKTHIIPQIMKDLHWCGNTELNAGPTKDPDLCFPQLQPYLQGVHCEMHICVFVRNNRAAGDPPKDMSTVPSSAFENASKCLFGI